MKIIGNVSDWLSYAGGALIKVADSAGSTVHCSTLAIDASRQDSLKSVYRFLFREEDFGRVFNIYVPRCFT